ncbi:hypothetical protein [Pseudomonas sp. CF161]|uniref:hypothetical protein n=1 Tax=Pseudomonas sp. CF161 TaxID=911241 RepID=UPI0003551107|nr:hypothetical protein [Pseudomonas sp. CF161]EPL04960.1 hypothetical protein CF161_23803 [Pseudomonas sp. CF161]
MLQRPRSKDSTSTRQPFVTRPRPLLAACLLMLMAAPSFAADPATPGATAKLDYLSGYSEQFGDFQVSRGKSSISTLEIAYKGRPYRPLNAWQITDVRPTGAIQNGQPVLLATTIEWMGVGTVVIAVQNDTPLARILSPVKSRDEPDWGQAQAGRSDLLLFPEGARAFVPSTGQVLWFDERLPGWGFSHYGMLVSVAPDNRSAAFLAKEGLLLSSTEKGVYAQLPISKELNLSQLWPLYEEASARARKALGEGRRIDQRRLQRALEVEWVGRQFSWQQVQGTWQLKGLGLTSSPLKTEH